MDKLAGWVVEQSGLVAWRLKTALQDGVGWFFGAVVCLALAGNCFSLSFHGREVQKSEVEQLFQSSAQAGRNEMRGVLGSSLAAPFESSLTPCSAGVLGYVESLRKALAAAQPNNPPTLIPCPSARCPASPPAWTDASTKSELRIPTGLVAVAGDPNKSPRLLELAARSRPIEDAHPPPPITAVYFVSPEGVLRYWPSGSLLHVPGDTDFASAPHVATARTSRLCDGTRFARAGSLSAPYLDLAGYGVVRTGCVPITANAAAGVLCFDIAPTVDRLEHGLASLDSVLEIDRADVLLSTTTARPNVGYCDTTNTCRPDGLRAVQRDRRDEVRTDLTKWLTTEASLGAIQPLRGNRWAVVLHREPVRENPTYSVNLEVGIVSLRDLEVIEIPPLMAGLLFLIGAAALVFVAHWRHRRRQQMGILRSAPVGVLVTRHGRVDGSQNEQLFVYFGNDRAEAILKQGLPRLNLELRTPTSVDIGDPKDREILERNDALRDYWIESTYVLTIKNTRVRVIGSPMLLPDGSLATYGVLIDPKNEGSE